MSLGKLIYYANISAIGIGLSTIVTNFIPYGVGFAAIAALVFAVLLVLEKTPEITAKKVVLMLSLAISVFGIAISF
ncbi:MAG: hypothetical protein PUP93_26830 [Rhizonema sp. NSF051]|nr:hypothetical protein [Rhizonema sp. NSF051]